LEEQSNGIYAPEMEQKYDFNDNFKYCCKALRKRVRADFDAVVGITGGEGVGKSVLANQIGYHTDKDYTLEKNCLFSPNPKNLIASIRFLPRFSTVNADEAIKILYKQQWWQQVFINKFYRLCRQDNKISIMCMPRFSEFNEGFRNHRILFWIHLLDRGIGVAYEKSWSPFEKDPWHFDDNQKKIEKQIQGRKYGKIDLDRKINILERSDNCIGRIEFRDLDPEVRNQYKELAAKHKYEGLEDEMDKGRFYGQMKKRYEDRLEKLVKLVQSNSGMSKENIAKELGISKARLCVLKDDEEE
jgi:hypothetical protein